MLKGIILLFQQTKQKGEIKKFSTIIMTSLQQNENGKESFVCDCTHQIANILIPKLIIAQQCW